MFTNCTSPLIKLSTYKDVIALYKKFLKKNKFDSLNTVTEIKEFYLKIINL